MPRIVCSVCTLISPLESYPKAVTDAEMRADVELHYPYVLTVKFLKTGKEKDEFLVTIRGSLDSFSFFFFFWNGTSSQ